jgi:hypothetical protein
MTKAPKTLLSKNHDLERQEPTTPETAPPEVQKPANLRANAVPLDGYVLSVDGKFKSRYENAEDAVAAGTKLKQTFPVIQVAIYDAAGRRYTPVELNGPEKAAASPQGSPAA